jgi:ligand-binding sensor domain-containing protein/serine phosphatase RsbU (regulator of sigma subunit)
MRIFKIFTGFCFLFAFACAPEHEKEPHDSTGKNDSIAPYRIFTPGTDTIALPITVCPDTLPEPLSLAYPKTGVKYVTINTSSGLKKIKLEPPRTSCQDINAGQYPASPIYNNVASGQRFFTTYTTDNGLAQDVISCGHLDKTGNLWFGTYGEGVSRYDGKSFTNYTIFQGLANNIIFCITEDKKGNFWFGTYLEGVSCYDGRSFTTFKTDLGLIDNSVRSIVEDKKGNIWFGTEKGVSRYDGRSFYNYTTSEGLVNNFVFNMMVDRNGNIWFSTKGGVSCYNGKTFYNFTTSDGLINNNVKSIWEDRDGNFWFGTQGGISRFEARSLPVSLRETNRQPEFTNFTIADGLVNNGILCITGDRRGNLWFGTQDGVSCYDGRSFYNFTSAQGLANDIVRSITEDLDGNLWFGTFGGGLSRYDGGSFVNFTTAQELSSNMVWTIMEDKAGKMWFGTYGGGLSSFDGKCFANFTTAQGLPDDNIISIISTRKGDLWFGTLSGGVSRYDGKSFTTYTTTQGLAGNNIRSMFEDTKGNIWFGTQEGGMSCYNGKSFTNFTSAQGLPNNRIVCIQEDDQGNIWLGTYSGGVSCFNGRSFINFSTAQGLSHDLVWNIKKDEYGNLWFCTQDGLSFMSHEVIEKISENNEKSIALKTYFINYSMKDGLPVNLITNIILSENGNIFVGTSKGIVAITGWGKGKPLIEVFNSTNGYPVKDINSGQNGMFMDSKGAIWAATGSDKTALVCFYYQEMLKTNHSLTVIIQNLKVNNENICWYDLLTEKDKGISQDTIDKTSDSLAILNEETITFGHILGEDLRYIMRHKFGDIQFDSITKFYPLPVNLILPYRHNDITFEFTAIEPARHFLVKYQYFLEGYNDDWSPVTDKTSASFGNIREGTYTFRLKACGPGDIWSEEVTYTFKVLPPWHRSWWFKTIYVSAFIISLVLLYRWRTANLRRRQKELEKKIREATAEIREQNEEITAQRDEISVQRDKIEAQRDTVILQKNIIENKNKNITDSIRYAQRIQQAILPNHKKLNKQLEDHFIFYRPKDIVSGDFYWTEEITNSDNETITLFAAIDCTGHGVPGAFMSLLGYNGFSQAVKENKLLKPGEILNFLSNYLRTMLRQENEESNVKDGMDLFLCSLNRNTMKLEYAGVHNCAYIIRNGELITLKPDNQPIAEPFSDDFRSYQNNEISMHKGDALYLFTDGYIDQFGGKDHKKFMSKRFRELLVTMNHMTMAGQKEKLSEVIDEWKGANEQYDDMLIMGLRI